jgi:hypothetical protein
VYETLCAETDAALAAGDGVIADATFLRRADRERLARVARQHRRPLVFVECAADEAVVRARLTARAAGPSLSDARWATYLAQRVAREPGAAGEPHLAVDTSAGLEAAWTGTLRSLWQWRQGRPLARSL